VAGSLSSSAAIVDGALHVVGGAVDADGRAVSWLPADAAGLQPVNCFLLVEGEERVLIDTGVARHEELVLAQLRQLVPSDTHVKLCMSRAELDCAGNVGAVGRAFGIGAVYTGGEHNPFDAFDMIQDVQRDAGAGRVPVERTSGDAVLALSGSRTVEMFPAPIRILSTFWVYDSGTRTLFTSDSFSHALASGPDDPRIVDELDVDLDTVRAHLFAKFGWLERADTRKVLAQLEAVFADRVIDAIAPVHGCVIRGPELVQAHYEAVKRVLDTRPAPAAGTRMPMAFERQSRGTRALPESTGGALPRALAPTVIWMGGCIEDQGFVKAHVHNTCYLVIGERETLLVDTGLTPSYAQVADHLDAYLGDRPLDWIFPTHSELPHVGNLHRLLGKYPDARITGDVRDYHLYYPQYRDRLVARQPGDELDLGGGAKIVFLPAPFKDLPNTMWAYEPASRVLFVADAFGYTHGGIIDPEADHPVHRPGECGLLSSELPSQPTIPQTGFITKSAFTWSQHVDSGLYFEEMDAILADHPADMLASAHGNVIDDMPTVLPIMRAAYEAARQGGEPS
jgi:flavorubredoxin